MRTGCHLCGGPDDECAMDCQSRYRLALGGSDDPDELLGGSPREAAPVGDPIHGEPPNRDSCVCDITGRGHPIHALMVRQAANAQSDGSGDA